ncbi:MAG: SpaA isopeptide-forming pilin-related protein, partial [Lachnospiraceae bacterium]|nr:SpaA isopeptide-forming pilin-related protein [Lachnospiraceae bacterium]
NAVPAITITQITDTGEKDLTKDTNAVQIKGSQITIAAAIVNSSKGIKISGLPVNGTAAEGEVVPKATYTINAGGNYISNNTFVGNADYYTIYKNAAGVALTSGADGSSQFSLDGDFGITIENVYSEVTLSATGTDKPDKKFDGMKFSVTPEGTTTPVITAAADNSGIAVIRGLPEGKYTVTGDADTIPAQYWMESKSQEITVNEQKSLTPSAVLSYKPMTLTVKSVDSRSGKAMANTKITVKKYVSSDKTTTVASATTDSNGQAKLVGVLERGAKYSITQNRVSGHYSATTSDLKSGTYTVEKQGADPTITFSNQPTVVKVGVIDNVSKTSPYSGSYVSGATIAIKKENAVLKTITTEGQLTEVVGLLDPNTKYQIVQTSAPAGYIIGAPTASGKYSVGKQIALSSRTRQEKTVAISADTVKVLVTRKGYDSRTQVTRNGKKAYEYTNLKILSGAKLEIRDKDGNVVKDKNGNAVSWTSSEKGGHLVEGVLAANTEYTLVETGAPTGYDLAGSGVFHTYKSGNQAAVTMQTRRASGTIRVVMRAAYKGNAIKVNGTYYCALFTDKNLTKRYTAAGVRRLTMTTSQVYAEATFENIPAGVYYVAETDKNGNPLKDNATFKVNNPEDGLHMDTSKDLIAEITNDYVTKPAGAQAVSSSELRNSYNAEYAGYGGSASAAAELAAGGNSVQTGDTTNVVLYLSMLAAACILFAAVLIKKRRKE